jgi:hypothetical protein
VRRDAGMRWCRPRRDLRASIARVHRAESAMKNFVAPLSFTLAAAWVVLLFVLVHGNP